MLHITVIHKNYTTPNVDVTNPPNTPSAPEPLTNPETHGINTFREHSLHHALKLWYAQPGDRQEVTIDGYVIDLVRDDLLIEIQTGNFSSIKEKLTRLLESHQIRLVYPTAVARWLVRFDASGRKEIEKRKKSPRKGHTTHIFKELVYIPHLMTHPNLSIEVLNIHDEEIQRDDGKGSWRRKKRSIADRHLLEVVHSEMFNTPQDLLRLLPTDLDDPFTTATLAKAIKQRRRVAQQMAYCLKHMGVIQEVGKQKQAILYSRLISTS